MKNAKPIRDPIYDYISISTIEKEVIDTPDFQRLRFVLQNSTAYLTYPNANNCRFLHSLGTMHLAGRIFIHGLKNSPSKDLIYFLSILDKLVKKGEFGSTRKITFKQWEFSLGNASRFLHDPISGLPFTYEMADHTYALSEIGESSNPATILEHDPIFLVNVFWQAIRIVGLVHDIGHLPMSHLFENAISRFDNEFSEISNEFGKEIAHKTKDYIQRLEETEAKELLGEDLPPIHELRGLFIFGKLYPNEDYPESINEFNGLIFSLARKILVHDPVSYIDDEDELAKVIRSLHRVVAGEIDADRLDYCVRDAKASGLELGAIDVERIVSNIVLCRDDQNQFFFIPSVKALSAVESFFHQRYLLYKYEIYHHNVARFDGLLEEILVWALEQGYSNDVSVSREVLDLLDKVCFVKQNPESNSVYRFMPEKYSAIYDDSWLRSVFSELYTLLNEGKQNTNIQTVCLMLETFLYRKTNNIYSFWKRDTDIQALLSEQSDYIGEIEELAPFTIDGKGPGKKLALEEFISGLKTRLGDEYVIIYKKLKPKIHKKGDLSSSLYTSNGICRVEDMSRYIESLNYSIENVPDVHISVLCKGIKLHDRKRELAVNAFQIELEAYLLNLKDGF